VLTLELGITQRDDVAGADLVVLLGGGVGQVAVDDGAVGASSNWQQGVCERFEKLLDQALWCAVSDDGFLARVDSFGDAAAELLVCLFELVLTLAGRWWFVSLLEFDV